MCSHEGVEVDRAAGQFDRMFHSGVDRQEDDFRQRFEVKKHLRGGERRRAEERGGEGRRGEERGGERRRAEESGGERRRAEESGGERRRAKEQKAGCREWGRGASPRLTGGVGVGSGRLAHLEASGDIRLVALA